MRRTFILLCLSFTLAASVLFGQDIPDSPNGALVKAYVRAFNEGRPDSVRSFFERYVSREALATKPVDERAARLLDLRSRLQSLRINRVVRSAEKEMVLAATTGSGEELFLVFEFDVSSTVTLASLRFETELDTTDGRPLSRSRFLDETNALLDELAQNDRFSGTVLIADNDSVLLARAFGYSEKRHRTLNLVETKYNLGSINKLFTRIAILQLAESGKLSLSDAVGAHLPEYPNRDVASSVTISQLLDMTSGLGDFFGERYDRTPKNQLRSLKDYVPLFIDDPLQFKPGTKRSYSNAGYILLGLIIEARTGLDYYTYVKKHIFEPAGMTHTDWYEMNSTTPNLATGYSRANDRAPWVSNIYTAPMKGSSAGGGYSTVHDMLSFRQSLTAGRLLGPRYTRFVLTEDMSVPEPVLPVTEGGLFVAGGAPGINSALEYDAATGRTVIVLSNLDPPTAIDVARRLSKDLRRMTP